MDFILITSCSSTRSVVPKVRVGDMPSGLAMNGALSVWLGKLAAETASITPRELYRGLGFMTLAKIWERFEPRSIKIVTGGLGLTDIDEKVVPYDFTASPKEPENIHKVVTAEPFVQTMWWRMINENRHQKTNPIRDLVVGSTGMCIISCSKIFLRYISDDILSIPMECRDRVRILLSASSQGSVPAQLRPMMIPFDREFVADMPGNRNDNNHRAAFRFLEMMSLDPEFAKADIFKQRQSFITLPNASPQSGEAYGYGRMRTDLERFLTERPRYLGMDWETAYKLTRRELGTVGGKMYFRSVFRKLTAVASNPVVVDESQQAAGVAALAGMGFLSDPLRQVNGGMDSAEESILSVLRVFVAAVKSVGSTAVFNASDICKWAPLYANGASGVTLPDAFESPNKLAYVLKANAENLGLVEVSVGSGKGYSLKQ